MTTGEKWLLAGEEADDGVVLHHVRAVHLAHHPRHRILGRELHRAVEGRVVVSLVVGHKTPGRAGAGQTDLEHVGLAETRRVYLAGR